MRLRIRVQPRGSRNRIMGIHDDALKVQVTAPPVEGAANEAVIEVLSKWLGVPRRAVAIVHGDSGRNKVVEIVAGAPAELAARVQAGLEGFVDKRFEDA